jgi:hypothetical protein
MENIKIFDDFFSDEILIEIKNFIINADWQKQNNEIIMIDDGDSPFYRIDLNNNVFYTNFLLKIIEEKINKKIGLDRVYIVGQNCYQYNVFHTDNELKNKITFCYYINNKNVEFGDLYIKLPNEKKIICIEPITNRGVFFPGTYIHRGSSYETNDLRICIAWKLTLLD